MTLLMLINRFTSRFNSNMNQFYVNLDFTIGKFSYDLIAKNNQL